MANAIIASGTTDFSDYSSRQVTIEVMGSGHQEMTRKGVYTMTVPYRCFSQTMQRIHRLGGKVTNITIPHHHFGEGQPAVEPAVSIPQPAVEPAVSIPQPAVEPAASIPQPAVDKAKPSDKQQTPKTTKGTQRKQSQRKPKR